MSDEAKPTTAGRQAALEAHRRGEIPLNEPAKYYAMGYDDATAKAAARSREEMTPEELIDNLAIVHTFTPLAHDYEKARQVVDDATAKLRELVSEIMHFLPDGYLPEYLEEKTFAVSIGKTNERNQINETK